MNKQQKQPIVMVVLWRESHGDSQCFNLEISSSTPQGSVLPADVAARTFLP